MHQHITLFKVLEMHFAWIKVVKNYLQEYSSMESRMGRILHASQTLIQEANHLNDEPSMNWSKIIIVMPDKFLTFDSQYH